MNIIRTAQSELAEQGFACGFQVSLENGTRLIGGASDLDAARAARIAAEWVSIRAGIRPLGSVEFFTAPLAA